MILSLLLVVPMFANAGERAGHDQGGGGDGVAAEFVSTGVDLFKNFEMQGRYDFYEIQPGLKVATLANILSSADTKIMSTDEELSLYSVRKDAINYPDSQNFAGFSSYTPTSGKYIPSKHEESYPEMYRNNIESVLESDQYNKLLKTVNITEGYRVENKSSSLVINESYISSPVTASSRIRPIGTGSMVLDDTPRYAIAASTRGCA